MAHQRLLVLQATSEPTSYRAHKFHSSNRKLFKVIRILFGIWRIMIRSFMIFYLWDSMQYLKANVTLRICFLVDDRHDSIPNCVWFEMFTCSALIVYFHDISEIWIWFSDRQLELLRHKLILVTQLDRHMVITDWWLCKFFCLCSIFNGNVSESGISCRMLSHQRSTYFISPICPC